MRYELTVGSYFYVRHSELSSVLARILMFSFPCLLLCGKEHVSIYFFNFKASTMYFNQFSVYVYCCYFSEKSNKEMWFGSIVQTIVDKIFENVSFSTLASLYP